jgi:hypothetical protein
MASTPEQAISQGRELAPNTENASATSSAATAKEVISA